MVFQKSTPFPKSIFDNVVFGPRVAGQRNKSVLTELAERWPDLWARVRSLAQG